MIVATETLAQIVSCIRGSAKCWWMCQATKATFSRLSPEKSKLMRSWLHFGTCPRVRMCSCGLIKMVRITHQVYFLFLHSLSKSRGNLFLMNWPLRFDLSSLSAHLDIP